MYSGLCVAFFASGSQRNTSNWKFDHTASRPKPSSVFRVSVEKLLLSLFGRQQGTLDVKRVLLHVLTLFSRQYPPSRAKTTDNSTTAVCFRRLWLTGNPQVYMTPASCQVRNPKAHVTYNRTN